MPKDRYGILSTATEYHFSCGLISIHLRLSAAAIV
jgi:hypothetical protein